VKNKTGFLKGVTGEIMLTVNAEEFANLLNINLPLFKKMRADKKLPKNLKMVNKGGSWGNCGFMWTLSDAKEFKKTFNAEATHKEYYPNARVSKPAGNPTRQIIFNTWLKSHKSKVTV